MSTSTPTAAHGEIVSLPGGSVLLQGHLEAVRENGVRPIRLPRRAWPHFPPNGEVLKAITSNAAGVRVSVVTAATQLGLRVRCTRLRFDDLLGPHNAFVAEIDGDIVGEVMAPVDSICTVSFAHNGASEESLAPSSLVEFSLPAGTKTAVVWLPQGMTVELLEIEADAAVAAAEPSDRPVWVHHGSSISHCVETALPTGAWPVIAARQADLELVNLGFGGQCMLDPFVADAIAATPADVISLKVGVNIVGARAMDQRTFTPALHGFIDRIRIGHPRTPIVLVSSILWPDSEDVPGPADVDFLDDGRVRCFTGGDPADVSRGALTMTESRRQIAAVAASRANAGEAIHYLDGLSLYGPDDHAVHPLPDNLHPDTELYAQMGRRFAAAVFGATGLVPRATLG